MSQCLAKEGEDLLSVPFTKRDGRWVSDLNNLRSQILFRIIEIFPSSKEVRETALPFFYRAIEAINSLISTTPGQQDPLAYHFPGFLENFQEGVKKLEEYAWKFQKYDKVNY